MSMVGMTGEAQKAKSYFRHSCGNGCNCERPTMRSVMKIGGGVVQSGVEPKATQENAIVNALCTRFRKTEYSHSICFDLVQNGFSSLPLYTGTVAPPLLHLGNNSVNQFLLFALFCQIACTFIVKSAEDLFQFVDCVMSDPMPKCLTTSSSISPIHKPKVSLE